MRKEPYGLMPIFAHRCMHHEIYGKRLQYETYKAHRFCIQSMIRSIISEWLWMAY